MTPQLTNFLIGAATASFIPFISFGYRKYTNWNDLRVVKKMIFKEYIDPLDKLTDNLNMDTFTKYQSEAGKMVKRLEYLLENEVKYMNTENRFAVIRMIQYTKMYFKAVLNKIIFYMHISPESKSNDVIERIPIEIKELTEKYKSTLDDYIRLKRDYLI